MAGNKETQKIADARPPKAFEGLRHTCTDCGEFLDAEDIATRMLDSDPNTIYFYHRDGCPVKIEW